MLVNHYRCFAADQRISMQIYADSLQSALQNSPFEVNSIQPHTKLEMFATNKWLMRYLRYMHYPRQISGRSAHIHHVLDHGYAHLLPKLGNGASCITVHDLIPLLAWKGLLGPDTTTRDRPHKNVIRKFRKPILNLHSLSFIPKFDQIIADSQNTANDLVAHLALEKSKISVIPPIIGSHFCQVSEPEIDSFAKRYALDRNCKWIMISGQEFYKNQRASLEVLSELNAQGSEEIKLVKSGWPSAEFDALVTSMGLEPLVRKIFLQDSTQLPLLYNFVDCLLFPSLYEGFGMPVVEALACGTPAVISNRGSLPEVGGELATLFDPFDIAGLSNAVYQALFNDDVKLKVRANASAWVEQFRAATVAVSIEKLYRQMATSTD